MTPNTNDGDETIFECVSYISKDGAVFSVEFRFVFYRSDERRIVLRRRGERYTDIRMEESDRSGGGSVMG